MKKLITVIAIGMFAIIFTGCSGDQPALNQTESSDNSVSQSAEQVDLNNLAIGDTAVFNAYSITIESIDVIDDALNVDVTMDANTLSTFATRYLDAFTVDGKKIKAEKQDDVSVSGGNSYSTTIVYKGSDISSLEWDNWNNEATWNFEPVLINNEQSESATSSVHDQVFYGWEAVREYGEHAYPYGFKLHSFLDAQVEENLYGDTWHLVAGCEIKNEYGKWAKNLTCNAVVTGSGEDWTVDSFVIE